MFSGITNQVSSLSSLFSKQGEQGGTQTAPEEGAPAQEVPVAPVPVTENVENNNVENPSGEKQR